jgi:dTDP-4-amino-4,6-dideoxygalactose transaminase
MPKLALLGGERTIPEERPEPGRVSFAEAFARHVGAEYALLGSCGTSALICALAGAGVGCGDEVIVPSFTWIASAGAILRVNAIPIFADIDPKTFCLDPEDVKKKITDQTKAILPVDIYGHPAPIPELMKIAEEYNLMVVEDAAQATGAQINGKYIGSLAHVTEFSFSGKPLASTSGGVMTTNDREIYERAMLFGTHPATLHGAITIPKLRKYTTLGLTGDRHTMDGRAQDYAYEQLQTLDARNNARIANANYLNEELSKVDGITPPYVKPGYKHVYHYYTCLYDEEKFGVPRDKFVEALRAEGLNVGPYVDGAYHMGGKDVHAGPLHYRAIYQELNVYGHGCPFTCPYHKGGPPKYEIGSLPVTEEITKKEFSLSQPDISAPNSRGQMKQYVEVIRKVIDNIDELRD